MGSDLSNLLSDKCMMCDEAYGSKYCVNGKVSSIENILFILSKLTPRDYFLLIYIIHLSIMISFYNDHS